MKPEPDNKCPHCGRELDERGCKADPRTWLRRKAEGSNHRNNPNIPLAIVELYD